MLNLGNKAKISEKIIISLVVITIVNFILLHQFSHLALADNPTPTPDYDVQIKEYEAKLQDTRNKAVTLSSQIDYMNNQIGLTEATIEQTKVKLAAMEIEIKNLLSKIDHLEVSLSDLSKVLLVRIQETYKQGRVDYMEILFSSKNFSDFLSKMHYLQVVQERDKKLMIQIEKTKVGYKDQKDLLEEKKKEEEALKATLEQQSVTLATQKKAEEDLLTITQNDERTFQSILDNLRRQKQGLLSAVSNSGASPEIREWSGDDNYFNQADSRWAYNLIGNFSDQYDPSYMWKYGCAVTSTAIVLSKLGFSDVNPGNLSQRPIYNADLISWNGVPSIYPVSVVVSSSPNWSDIDQYLNNGNWVIVHVYTGTANGHYIVLKNKDGDDYKIHDPYFGPNLELSRYGKSSVGQVVVFQRN